MQHSDRSSPRILCVAVRGWTDGTEPLIRMSGNPGGQFPKALRSFMESLPGVAKVIYPSVDLSLTSSCNPEDLVDQILGDVDATFDAGQYDRVVFVAYSAGAPLVRYALMRAYGADEMAPPPPDRAWVSGTVGLRVVYMSGILRGWSYSTAMPPGIRFIVPFFSWLGKHLSRKKLLILALHRGEPFIVRGRIMQAALRAKTKDLNLPFERVTFLGTQDEYVAPSDCIELISDQRQVFFEIPSTNHLDMLDVNDEAATDPNVLATIEIRKRLISQAILQDLDVLRQDESALLRDDDVNDYFDPLDRPRSYDDAPEHAQTNSEVKDAVIVLHGIRDEGYWTKRVARRLKHKSVRPLLRAPSPSYGFFSMRDFMSPGRRRKQTLWFLEQYADVRECYPAAKVSFVGHSNGTFLAGHALELCDLVVFDKVVLAGSVLRTDFDWARFDKTGQIKVGVLNLKGTRDGVVAFLPGAMQKLGLGFLNVGGGGFYGFPASENVKEYLIEGRHKAGISEKAWPIIADFVSGETLPDEAGDRRSGLWSCFGYLAPAVTFILAGLLLCGVAGLIALVLSNVALGPTLIAALFGLWLIGKIVHFY